MRVVATAGHVDHGKSALLERLTGMQPDRWEQERRRGLTIDLGYVWTDLDGPEGPVTVAFVDVPGHDQFIPNMLSGVGVVDRVLFVVAADDGWAAQSEEHLAIVELLGLPAALVVVTKADLAGDARTDEVVATVEARLADTPLAEAPILCADSITGRGLDEVRSTLAARLTTTGPGGVDDDARLWVDRAFTAAGAGTVVTGMLASGRLVRQQRLAVLPAGTTGRVRGLQTLGQAVEAADAGARVAVNLGGVGLDTVTRGSALVDTDTNGRPHGLASTRMDVELRALPHAAIGARGAWHLHLGTASTTVRIRPLLGDVAPGERGFAQLELAEPLPARHGDRFVLRDAGRRTTAGGGRVLDPEPASRPRGTEGRLAHALVLEELRDAGDEPGDVLRGLVDAHGGTRHRAGLRAAVGRVVGPTHGLEELSGHLVRPDRLADWTDAVTGAAATGSPEVAATLATLTTAAAARGCPEALVGPVLDRAVAEGRLVSHGGRFVHCDDEATYLAASDRRRRRLREVLEAEPFNPPDPASAVTDSGAASFELQAMVDAGELVVCGPLVFTADAIHEAVRRLRDGPGRDGAGFTASDAKGVWETTRRAAVPLLEHLRATRVTTFDGTHHRLR